jgi:hypothetical protein
VTPFDRIEPVHYVDANTGAVVETVQMRRFYGWNTWDPNKKPRFEMIREYAVDREADVNPTGAKP